MRNARTGRYMFAPQLFDLANAALNVTELRDRALPLLRNLMRKHIRPFIWQFSSNTRRC